MPDTIPFGSPPIGQTIQNSPPQATVNPAIIPFNAPPITTPQKPELGDIGKTLVDSVKSAGKSIIAGAEKDIASPAATPVQLIAKALNLPDPYSQGVPGTFGNIPVAPATPEGFLQKAGEAGQLASYVAAPGAAGALKTAGIFELSGVANSLASGNTNPASIARDGIWSGILGLGVGVGGNFFSHIANSEALRTGVSGVTKDAVANSDPSLVSNYINAAKNHGESMADLSSPTPVGLMENEFDTRAANLTENLISKAGAAVGEAKQAASQVPLVFQEANGAVTAGKDAASALYDKINNVVMQMTGHGFGLSGDVEQGLPGLSGSGERNTPTLYQLPGREVQLSNSEESQLTRLQGYLGRLLDKPTAGAASDILTNINTDIGKWNDPQFGSGNSPVQGALKYAYGQINQAIRGASPELADASANYHDLMALKDDVKNQAGSAGQSSALMMRRVLSGDKANSVVPTLNEIDAVTAPGQTLQNIRDFYKQLRSFTNPTDASAFVSKYVQNLKDTGRLGNTLVQHSILGKWATDMFGTTGTKQLFAEGVAEGQNMSQGISSIFGYPKQFVSRQLNSLFTALAPDPAEYAMSVANGKPLSMNIVSRNLDKLLDTEINTPVISPIVSGIQDTLKGMGVTAQNLEPAAKAIFKTWLLNRLTQPKPDDFPLQSTGVPNAILPAGITQPVSSASSPSLTTTVPQSTQEAQQRSLTSASTGQGMAAQARKGGFDAMPNGLNLGNPGLSLS